MTTNDIEQAVLNQFDNGRYSPLGADGGALKYVTVNVNGDLYRASITLDHEIAQVRRIWELDLLGAPEQGTTNAYSKQSIFNFTKQYYQIREV